MASESSTLITDAPEAASRDAANRKRWYLILQGFRVVGIMVAFLIPGWPKWIVIFAAAILPGIAVLIANQPPNEKARLEAEQASREAAQTARAGLTDGSYEIVPGEVCDEGADRDSDRDSDRGSPTPGAP